MRSGSAHCVSWRFIDICLHYKQSKEPSTINIYGFRMEDDFNLISNRNLSFSKQTFWPHQLFVELGALGEIYKVATCGFE
jgi:hypothetical protein